jgi:hypothetical protein
VSPIGNPDGLLMNQLARVFNVAAVLMAIAFFAVALLG